jgi:deazaflavin-dependent oxidoreductase (nitroreductase family)
MNVKPSAFQKLVHRFLMLRPASPFLAAVLHHADKFMLALTRGRYAVTRIVGLPIIQLTMTGAKSGERRTMPLVGLPDGETIILIASNYGRKHSPGWYYNLKAHPECQALFDGTSRTYHARESFGNEREKYFRLAVSYYAGYEKYVERAAPRIIPVMVLEPKDSFTTNPA